MRVSGRRGHAEGGTGQAGQVATEGYCNSWSFLVPKVFCGTPIENLKLFLNLMCLSFFLSFAFKFKIPWDLAAGQRDAWPGSLSMAGWSYIPWKLPKWFEAGMNNPQISQMGSGWKWGCLKIILLHDWWICFQVWAQWWDNLLQRVKLWRSPASLVCRSYAIENWSLLPKVYFWGVLLRFSWALLRVSCPEKCLQTRNPNASQCNRLLKAKAPSGDPYSSDSFLKVPTYLPFYFGLARFSHKHLPWQAWQRQIHMARWALLRRLEWWKPMISSAVIHQCTAHGHQMQN